MELFKKVLLATLVALALSAAALPQTANQVTPAPAATFEERLGTAEGAALAILFGANMRGNLDLCDCSHPRGGIARRVGYVEGFKKRFKDTPVVQVEAGQFWYNAEV